MRVLFLGLPTILPQQSTCTVPPTQAWLMCAWHRALWILPPREGGLERALTIIRCTVDQTGSKSLLLLLQLYLSPTAPPPAYY